MSDESAPIEPAQPTAGETPTKVRRISNPRAKKAAKVKPVKEEAAPVEAPADPVVEPAIMPAEKSAESVEHAASEDWPEPEPASAGAQQTGEGNKRKRRRRKGKGGNAQQNGVAEEGQPATVAEGGPSFQQPRPVQPPQQQPHRPRIDPEQHTKMAWKIYLAEVSEEGVALIGDHDAKELARRCFRLAEIFIEEQSRRKG